MSTYRQGNADKVICEFEAILSVCSQDTRNAITASHKATLFHNGVSMRSIGVMVAATLFSISNFDNTLLVALIRGAISILVILHQIATVKA